METYKRVKEKLRRLHPLIIAAIVFLAGLILDKQAAFAAATLRNSTLTLIANTVSSTAILVVIAVPAFYLFIRDKKKLPALFASLLMALMLSYAIKFILGFERPSGKKEIPFTNLPDYSFPSSHATIAFTPTAIMAGGGKIAWIAFGIAVALSRIYLGMHLLSETIAGAILGYLVGRYFAESSRFEMKKDFMEIRRQAFHLFSGIIIALLLYYEIINSIFLLGILATGLALSLISKKTEIPIIALLLKLFERKEAMRTLPGKGAITLVGGSLIATLIFPKDVALASILILAAGDSISHVIGRFFGRTKQPLSVKLIEGTIAGIVAGFLGAIYFVGLWEALAASAIAMTLETLDFSIWKKKVDDNLLIPLAAGTAIMLIRYFKIF